jgi:[acyl-carrier-protein] S-malonyltransferase
LLLKKLNKAKNNQAFIFPGQGSQSLGMLSNFSHDPLLVQTFEQASSVLGFDLWTLTQEDEVRIHQTSFAQPALLTASVALFRLCQSQFNFEPASTRTSYASRCC